MVSCGSSISKHKKRIQESMRKEFVQLIYNFNGSRFEEDAWLTIMKSKHWIPTS